jgi:hypothetical protein
MNQVQVTRKELSNGLQAILVTVNGQEGMLLPHLAKVLGVTQSTLKDHCTRHRLLIARPDADQILDMQKLNVINLKTRRVNLLPRETVRALIKLVGTPETWAIFEQMWEVVNNVYNGNVVQAMTDTGVVPKDAREYLRMALAELDKAVEENDRLKGTITNIDKAPLEYAVPKALRAKDIIIEFPALNDYAQRWFKQKFIRNHAKLKVFSLDTARLTYFLKARHQISANIVAAEVVKNPSKKGELCTRALYDRTTIANLAKEYEKATA